MIQAVIAFLNSRLDVLNLYKDIRGLCEQIQQEAGDTTKTFPAEWCDENYQHVDVNINPEEGIAYHRQTGPMTETEDTEEGVTACDVQVTRTYPMRIVSYIPKNVLSEENNNQYIDDKLATNITNTLKTINDQVLSAALKASSVSVDIISTQKDRYTVYAEEYTLPAGHVPKFEYAYFAVDYNIIITATQGCFENFDCDGFVVPTFCEVIVTDANNPSSPVARENGQSYECFPCPNADTLTCQELNDQLDQPQRQVIQRVNALVTGQTNSFLPGDDGDLERGRLVDFLTLNCNNFFGNTNRFTDSVGGAVYGAGNGSIPDYMIDHSTGKGLQFNTGFDVFAVATLANAILAARAHDNGTFSDFEIPNIGEAIQTCNFGVASSLWNYAPINKTATKNIWSCTTNTFSATRGYRIITNGNTWINTVSKVGTQSSIYIRKHF